ncbi:hypothetical protein LX66_4237 [Chitinophaga japonensis]|uniref:Uncharacterized protein n=2 Tax=Chitinophaga japonensis TaxID=104662 RepID=A0A562T2J4_CHIJA|nr:hypothetical protein LX66_4237 [Chitinophaga japonensis]
MKDVTTVAPQKLLSLASQLVYGHAYPNPDDSKLPPNPWDPLVRRALERVALFGPGPQPWQIIARRRPEVWDMLGDGQFRQTWLNPQPLPPGIAFAYALAREALDRAHLLYDVAAATGQHDDEQSAEKAARFIYQFADDLCPVPPKITIPPKDPRPDPQPRPEWSALELAVVALEFHQAAAGAIQKNMQEAFTLAADKIAATAADRM